MAAMGDTAILLFSRTSEAEASQKVLLDAAENGKLLQALRVRSINAAKKSTLPFFEYNEHHQAGRSFGERIANAFESLFHKGYNKVICIGSDCPELDVTDLEAARAALETNGLVAGPDQRGGAFLIGLDKALFDRRKFEKLNWQTDSLLKSLSAYIEGNIQYLQAKFDLNDRADIAIYGEISTVLSKLLRVLATETLWSIPIPKALPQPAVEPSNKRRGPPSLA